MIKLQLKIDGKKRTFTQNSISSRKMRNLLAFYTKMENEDNGMSELDMIDETIMLVEGLFDDSEVNFDNILDGTEAKDLMPTLHAVFEQVMTMGDDEKKVGKNPASASRKPAK